ncbi:MAG: alkaline phosphatase, partial [Pseudomonadota bacterium]
MYRSLMAGTAVLSLMSGAALAEMNFNRIASFATHLNMAEGEDTARETSPEIISATGDGMILVYTDSPLGVLGRIDIADPANPQPMGNIALDGEPTAVAMIGPRAFVGINTSESFVAPSGQLALFNARNGNEISRCDLGGQPDSVAAAPDGSFVVVAIENERDEDLNDGVIPQMPAGGVAIIPVDGREMDCAGMVMADVTGLAEVAPSDPEPEFVDVNAAGEIVVSLQENNHMVVLSSAGEVLSHFSAGAVDLEGIDVDEEGAYVYDGAQPGRVREPDSVKWIDDDHFATANEGDYEGGSRSWTIFNQDGSVVYESGTSFEQ